MVVAAERAGDGGTGGSVSAGGDPNAAQSGSVGKSVEIVADPTGLF